MFTSRRSCLVRSSRLAFSTAKGELVRSILYPKPVDFKFNTDTYKYVGGMALIALCGMIFSIVLRVGSSSRHARDKQIVHVDSSSRAGRGHH
jgi:hypothetical protein